MATFNSSAKFTVQLLQKPLGELIELNEIYGIEGDFKISISGANEMQFDEIISFLKNQFPNVNYCFELRKGLNVKILMD